MEETVHVWHACKYVFRHLMQRLLIASQRQCTHGCRYVLRYNVVPFKYITNLLSD